MPPHDLDAEAAVIATVMLARAMFDVVIVIVQSPMFYSDANKLIFQTIEELVAENDSIDEVVVAARLKMTGRLDRAGGMPYLAQIVGATPAVANVATHAEIVRDKWQARQLILRAQRFAAEAYVGESPALEIIQRAETSFGELSSFGVGSELVHVGAIIGDEVEIRARLRESGDTGRGTGAPTGFVKLDNMTGGLYDADFTVVAGRPGMGKTTFVMNALANVTRPKPDELPFGAAFFSLEMPRSQVAIRFACAEGSVSMYRARKNSFKEDEWERFETAARELTRFPLWIDDSSTLTLLDIRARVRKLQRDIEAGRAAAPCSRLKVVAIDYMQLMQGIRGKNDTREGEVASISRGLKALAKDLGLTVIGVSQLNRSPEKSGGRKEKRPELSDLRESGAIEQDADNVWFVYREKYYDDDADPTAAEILVKKDRNGPTGTVPLRFDDSSVRFYDRADESYDDLSEDFDNV